MAPALPSNYYPNVRYRASPAVPSNSKPPFPWPPASAAAATATATTPPPPPPPPLVARPLPAFHTSFQMVPVVADPSSSSTAAGRNGSVKPPSPAPNYGSSGSHHDPTSVCLHAMVHEFLEDPDPALDTTTAAACGRVRCNCCTNGDGACSPSYVHEDGCGMNDEVEGHESNAAFDDQFLPLEHQLREIVQGVGLSSGSSTVESRLVADAKSAMEEMEMEMDIECSTTNSNSNNVSVMGDGRVRRAVMKRLRRDGHNAAICKSRWSHGGGLPAGDYEYIDVVVSGGDGMKTDRYIVDIDFKAQFEIARASDQYRELMAALPRLFVGRPEHLKQIVKTMCASAKRSLKDQGLHLPPWRKQRYMLCKWFASYRRTTAPTSSRITPKSSEEDLLGLGLGLGFGHAQSDLQPVAIKQEMDISFFKAQARAAATMLSACAAAVSTKTGFDREPQAAAMETGLYGGPKTAGSLGKVSASRSGLSAALKLQNQGVMLQSS